jgi:N-acetylglucosaminyldiphosphoundecaprenol N-acetyl-beta-D-mannosaminyltransferase
VQWLFGLDFVSSTSIREVADLLIAHDSSDDEWRCVVTPNVDHLVRYDAFPEERDVARNASVVLPDGMPIVWASRLLGRPLAARLTGADLFAALWSSIVDRHLPVVLIVSNTEVAERLLDSHPQARCIVPPMFDRVDTEAVSALIEEIDAHCTEVDARYLIIGISMPKHHALARELRKRWEGSYSGKPMVLLMGQSPEFAVGLVRRAPRWMQRSGLEWVWRLTGDPRRLARRYLVTDVRFLLLLWKEAWAVRRRVT